MSLILLVALLDWEDYENNTLSNIKITVKVTRLLLSWFHLKGLLDGVCMPKLNF